MSGRFSKNVRRNESEVKKQLKIKSGSCKRLTNELRRYLEERKQHEEKLEKLVSENADGFERKRQDDFLQETVAVIQSTRQNLITAYEALNEFLRRNCEDPEIVGTEELAAAEQILRDSESVLD
eukprot:TRINITY_DN8487_c0_g1_i1.p1 TRINITY_DN8487_c0_g1~~TRINITY_DN8487_c0_g1_i1.p1  ORF type:complete len:124 (-),score=9.80 TRINITY_DN8487_c0_g1_i1:259-630(-)